MFVLVLSYYKGAGENCRDLVFIIVVVISGCRKYGWQVEASLMPLRSRHSGANPWTGHWLRGERVAPYRQKGSVGGYRCEHVVPVLCSVQRYRSQAAGSPSKAQKAMTEKNYGFIMARREWVGWDVGRPVLALTPRGWEWFSEPVWHTWWVTFALLWFGNSAGDQEAGSALPARPLRAGRQRVRVPRSPGAWGRGPSALSRPCAKIQLWLHRLGEGQRGDFVRTQGKDNFQ